MPIDQHVRTHHGGTLMKKIFATFVIVAMTSLGLVATTGGTASAACPYSACIDTITTPKAKPTIRVGRHGHIKVTVTAAGNVLPTGTVTVTVTRIKGGYSFTKTRKYAGKRIRVKTATITKKGKYKVTATYNPPANSIFNPSTGYTKFRAKKKFRNH
jgi:hypothetical protein